MQKAPPVRATVVICTRNRADSLCRTLESLAAMAPTDAPWELLIVDNGSSDRTPEVVQSFADRLPIRRIYEAKAGLSNARNAGVEGAVGAYLLWTDDDVLVDRDWLNAYLAAFDHWPEAAVFGGKTRPQFEEPKADWMVKAISPLRDLLAIRDFGDAPVPLDRTVIPYGLNYAIRAKEQRAHPYDPELGVAPGRRIGGEETAVISAILETAAGYWLPDALIIHLIPRERQTRAYVRHYYEARGEAMARWPATDTSPTLAGIPRWRWRRLWVAGLGYAVLSLAPGQGWVNRLIDYSIQRGWIRETRKRLAGGTP